jgi:hypothetical protein
VERATLDRVPQLIDEETAGLNPSRAPESRTPFPCVTTVLVALTIRKLVWWIRLTWWIRATLGYRILHVSQILRVISRCDASRFT